MDRKFVMITAATRLETLVARFNSVSQARFYVEHLGADFGDYEREHQRYQDAASACRAVLEASGRLQLLPRDYLSSFLFGPEDIVVALGRDGLVANSLKYLRGQALLGVNPEPERWDGILLPFGPADLGDALFELGAGRAPVKEVSMAKVTLADGRSLLGVNDLFIGARSHISARYSLRLGGKEESQSSSGIIVSTGLGSSGWLKSVVAGAQGILDVLEGVGVADRKKTAKTMKAEPGMKSPPGGKAGPGEASTRRDLRIPWDADYLYYTVREPFPSRSSQAGLVFGRVDPGDPLIVTSQMPEQGVIFSDGMERDYLEFSSGTSATIGLAEVKGRLVRKD